MDDDRLFGHLFLGAGAMKAGSCWLHSALRRHPELNFALEMEIGYFYHVYVDDSFLGDFRRLQLARDFCNASIDRCGGNANQARAGLRWTANFASRPVDDFWYRMLFERPRRELYACDFSPLHARLPAEAWPRIEAKCDKLRVLCILRDPVEQFWSDVKFHLQKEGRQDILKSLDADEIGRCAARSEIREHSEFGEAIRNLKAGVPDGALKVMFHENLQEDKSGALAEIEEFLEIRRMKHASETLEPKTDESSRIPMPDWFPGLFAEDAARIRAEVKDQGLALPKSWRD